jgi:hypothetical protein
MLHNNISVTKSEGFHTVAKFCNLKPAALPQLLWLDDTISYCKLLDSWFESNDDDDDDDDDDDSFVTMFGTFMSFIVPKFWGSWAVFIWGSQDLVLWADIIFI